MPPRGRGKNIGPRRKNREANRDARPYGRVMNTQPMSSSVDSERNPADEMKWAAVVARDRATDGTFVYAVRTTGVYCRPSCAGRPLRKNVEFHASPADAERAGFRACKRCRPG